MLLTLLKSVLAFTVLYFTLFTLIPGGPAGPIMPCNKSTLKLQLKLKLVILYYFNS